MIRITVIVLSMLALAGCTALVVGGAEGGYDPCEEDQPTDERCRDSQ